MKPNIGIAEKDRKGLVAILNALLADEYVLYTKTRNYHWNVVGAQFRQLHELFEAQYEELADVIDEVAERVRSLGGRAGGSLSEFLEQTRLKEQTGDLPDAAGMLASLLSDHESIIQSLRADLGTCAENHPGAGACDFLAPLIEKHEKTAWMLRAHLS